MRRISGDNTGPKDIHSFLDRILGCPKGDRPEFDKPLIGSSSTMNKWIEKNPFDPYHPKPYVLFRREGFFAEAIPNLGGFSKEDSS